MRTYAFGFWRVRWGILVFPGVLLVEEERVIADSFERKKEKEKSGDRPMYSVHCPPRRKEVDEKQERG